MMKIEKLSLLMITKNAEELLEKSLVSCRGLVDEIIAVDNFSKDQTREILKKFGAKIYIHPEEDLGKQRAYGLKKVSNEWVLVLDADEILSQELKKEIRYSILAIRKKIPNNQYPISNIEGYLIPFQNHFLGKPINYGGENYKMLRLFRKNSVEIKPSYVHEGFQLKSGKPGLLQNKIYHFSYRSIPQMFSKFTDYSVREAKQKIDRGEKPSLRKIFFYPLHMFWARFIEDKGYKDGLFRIPLDFGFAYMEMMTYVLLWIYGK